MHRIVDDDTDYKPYKRPRKHKIIPGANEYRLECIRKLLYKLKHIDAGKVIIFTDEKYFTLAQYSNRQNDKLIWLKGDEASAPDDLCHIGQVQCPTGVMFFGAVASNGKVAPPDLWRGG